jgi:hypothetical protein
MNTSELAPFKVGQEITVFVRHGRTDVPIKIGIVSRVLKTKLEFEWDRQDYELRRYNFRPTIPEDRAYLANRDQKLRASREAQDAREQKMQALRSLVSAFDLTVSSSNQDGRYDLCGLTEDELRALTASMAHWPKTRVPL